MRILGHGIDIIELQRVESHLASEHRDWADAIFTDVEQSHADSPPNTVRFFAGRYAAKEAIAKALGTGFSDDVAWLDVEIVRCPSGALDVRLSSGALDLAKNLGVTKWFLSISHGGGYAVASAIAAGE